MSEYTLEFLFKEITKDFNMVFEETKIIREQNLHTQSKINTVEHNTVLIFNKLSELEKKIDKINKLITK